jgi:hypothetical protein
MNGPPEWGPLRRHHLLRFCVAGSVFYFGVMSWLAEDYKLRPLNVSLAHATDKDRISFCGRRGTEAGEADSAKGDVIAQ